MITIVGAGLVGSLWAVLLQKKGIQVQVFEKRSDIRLQKSGAGRSINLVITSRGIHGLEKAGLRTQISELAVPVYGRMIHSRTGELTYQAYGQDNECNLSISRDILNKFLIAEAEKAGAKIYFDHELVAIEPLTKSLAFKTPQGAASHKYQILFGADGAGSNVRKQLAMLFPLELDERIEWLDADYKELTLPLGSNGEPQLRTNALHIWPRGSHMMMGLANRDGSFTMTTYFPKASSVNGSSAWSFDKIKKPDDVKKLFQEDFADAIPMMPNFSSEFMEHPQGALGTIRCKKWVFNDSIALMGDAAHAIVPFFGQGMNLGFEDCTTLLDLFDKNGSDWSKILNQFDQIQRPNANAIADMALENWVEMRDKVADNQFLLRKKIEGILEQKFPKLYKSRYGMITYTLIPYSTAQKVGIFQMKMLDELTEGISSIDQISWEKAESLIKKYLAQ